MKYKTLLLLLCILFLVSCGAEEEAPPDEPSEPEPTSEQETNTTPTDQPSAESTNTPEPEPTEPPPTEPPPTEAVPTETPSLEVTQFDEISKAIVRIEAQGTFVDPEIGYQANSTGGGSGFLINEDGLAVTNNHVVTGAGLLRVYLNGEDSPRNAKILGVSECSDLAVIDIEGSDFPHLSWYSDDVPVGLEVFAAGYPLSDTEFTLTRGIISKANANGETTWSSVDSVIEHDATINPGNSGGPLVSEDGQVVGINYAGISETSQYYAIKYDIAETVITQLAEGNDVNSLGINGTAVNDGEGLSGIWVSSVNSGSPADNAGIEAGDIITSLEGLFLATDGSMADYCDILRSNTESEVLNVQVFRYSTSEILEGQINGEKLEVTQSFADDSNDNSETDDDTVQFVTIYDDLGILSIEVPTSWSDQSGLSWIKDGDEEFGIAIRASSDLDAFYAGWDVSGVFFGATNKDDRDIMTYLDNDTFDNICTYVERTVVDNDSYKGNIDLWENCGGDGGSILINAVARPPSGEYLVQMQIVILSNDDFVIANHILETLYVDR